MYDNAVDVVDYKISGKEIIDTIIPYIKQFIYSDTIIKLICSEFIDSYSIEIYPEYVKYSNDKTKNKIYIHLMDTLGTYPIELVVNNIKDMNGNENNKDIAKYFFNKGDTLFLYSIEIPSIEKNLFIYNTDTIIIGKNFSNGKDSIIFRNLMQGEYYIGKDKKHLQQYIVGMENE